MNKYILKLNELLNDFCRFKKGNTVVNNVIKYIAAKQA